MTASCGRIETLVMRMQGDFLENPELTLTLPQAQHRFDVDDITCKAVLSALVDAGVLANVHGGTYVGRFPRLIRTAGAGAPGQRQRPGQRQSAIRPIVGHAA
jgi:hypothetical protein